MEVYTLLKIVEQLWFASLKSEGCVGSSKAQMEELLHMVPLAGLGKELPVSSLVELGVDLPAELPAEVDDKHSVLPLAEMDEEQPMAGLGEKIPVLLLVGMGKELLSALPLVEID